MQGGEDVWKQADGSGWPVCLSCVRGACNSCLSQQREQESQEPEWRSTTAKAEWCSALSAPFLPKRVGRFHRRAWTWSARTRRITHWEQIRQPSLAEGEKNCHFIFVPPPLLLPSFCSPPPFLSKAKIICCNLWKKGASTPVNFWLNSLGKGGEPEPERGASDHLNPTCDSPAQVSYSGGSKVSLRGVFTALVTHRHADH